MWRSGQKDKVLKNPLGRDGECCYKSRLLQRVRHRELAQLVERHPYKVDVAGSNPVLPTKLTRLAAGFFMPKTPKRYLVAFQN